jgi:SSS family solute:Na+ symporter
MKMKTQVVVDPQADNAALAASYADPRQYDDRKLFGRHSNWEFDKWDRLDTVGFILSVLVVLFIIAMLCALISFGK